jgi:hypothetical protein
MPENFLDDTLCGRHEIVMTIQLSKQAIGLPKMGSGLVRRLVCARNDPGKERIRRWLIDLDDAQLQSGLGLTVEYIAVLRTCTKTASPMRSKGVRA